MKINITCYEFKNNMNREICDECEKLEIDEFPDSHRLVRNYSDYVICAYDDNKLIGFLTVHLDYKYDNGFYIGEIIVKEDYRRNNVASEMLKVAIKHSSGFDVLTASVKKENTSSNRLISKFMEVSPFSEKIENNDRYLYKIDISNIKDRKKIQDLVKLNKR